jgi:hypothetical protein
VRLFIRSSKPLHHFPSGLGLSVDEKRPYGKPGQASLEHLKKKELRPLVKTDFQPISPKEGI